MTAKKSNDGLISEAADVARERADALAGRVGDSAEVKAWIDSIGTAHELGVPYAGP